MEYIINPAWFYWLSVADGILGGLCGAVVISAIAALILGTLALCNLDDQEGDVYPFCKKWGKRAVAMMLVSVLCYTFIPSKDTLIEMQVARIATVDNAKLTVDALKSAVDYIINAINSLK